MVIALSLLTGAASYLVADQGKTIWSSARHSTLNLALGHQAAASALLGQSVLSLHRLAGELADNVAPAAESTTTALRTAILADSVSVYLGARSAEGGTVLVDRAGRRATVQVERALPSRIPAAQRPELHFWPVIQLPGDAAWYVPVTLGIARQDGAIDTVFALVSQRQLIAGGDNLRVLPDSWITLLMPDGTRIFSYQPSRDFLEVNDPPLNGDLLARLTTAPFGTLEDKDPVDGILYLIGTSRSSLPLYAMASVPVSSLYATWLKQSLAPFIVLLLGLIAVAIFAWQLRAALVRQQSYVTQQETLAKHDMLTGLLNRDAFMRFLEEQTARGPQHPFAVLLLDLNRFKDINDTLGHAVGDRVLAEAGSRLKGLMSDADHVARLGGDELAVFVEHGTSELTEALCIRVQECLSRTIHIEGVELDLTASIGAAFHPNDAQTATELLRCADIAMYGAKGDLKPYGRYSRDMDNFTPEMLALKCEFAKALRSPQDGGLSIVYQPKVQLADGALVGLEALSRWEHPTMGAVPPSKYVHLIENTELIHPFTQSVLKAAITQIADWRAAGYDLPVSVNISANNLLDHAFVEKLRELLESGGVPAHLLELEVTESAVMRHPDAILKRLYALRELGVGLAIDDFGIGYASLSYLKRLPVQTLKIDKSFVLNLAVDEADQRIVRSSIQLAHGFGMSVVAEGVESAAVADLLRNYGCDDAQGFHFARPKSAREIEELFFSTPESASHPRVACA